MYEILDHTADIGLKIWNPTLAGLFSDAGHGITSLLASGDICPEQIHTVLLERDSIVELFHDWLDEINYLFTVHHKLFSKFIVLEVTPKILRAELYGETYSAKHVLQTEIKAVTYHQICVQEDNMQWMARIYFDL